MISLFASITHHAFSYNIGHLQLTGFGLAILLAFAIAQIVAQRELWRRGYDPTPIGDLIIAAVIGGLVGAKVYFAILMGDIGALLTRAGFVFWGGLIGGIIAVIVVAMVKGLRPARIADEAGIAVAAAYSLGRIGCWAVGDDYGRPWDGALAVKFPNGAPPSTVENMMRLFHIHFPMGMRPFDVVSVYPTQLFEVTLGFVMFLILWRMRDHKHAEGWLFGVYCALAGVERFIIEFFRAKDDRFFGPFTTAQVVAVIFVFLGIAVMMARWQITARAPGIYAADRKLSPEAGSRT
jgi:phosphatidylglycerol:prolipoprotein diacylglycerol transferase